MTNSEKKKRTPFQMVWDVAYPVLLYYAILLVSEQFLYFLGTKINTSFGQRLSEDYSLLQMIGALICIPFLFSMYCNDRNGKQGMWNYIRTNKVSVTKERLLAAGICAVAMIFLGFGMNNVLYMSGAATASSGFQEANTALYSGSIWTELISSGFLIPILEELVYRGVVQYRMRQNLNKWWAIGISTLCFAIMHANAVQMIYAAILGFLLGLMVEKTGHVLVSTIGHMAVNIFAIVRSENGWLENLEKPSTGSWAIAIASVALGIAIVLFFARDQFHKE